MEFNFSLLMIGAGTLWAMRVVILYLSGQAMIRYRTREFRDPDLHWDRSGELSNALLTPLLIAFAATLIAMDFVLRKELAEADPMTSWLLGVMGTPNDNLGWAISVVWSSVWWGMLVWVSYITSLQAAHSYAMVLLRRGFDLSQKRPPHIALPLMLNVLIDTIWLPLILNLGPGLELLDPDQSMVTLGIGVIAAVNLTIAFWFLWRLWHWTSDVIAMHDDPTDDSTTLPPSHAHRSGPTTPMADADTDTTDRR
ncbi:MAG: hypothetical protein Alpg2KO_23480 [Alphaproteobacteria bacterium]